MIVLDTTILVYAVGHEHPLRSRCRDLIAAVGEGEVQATTTPEVLQEFAHVRARRSDRDEAVALTQRFNALLSPLLTVEGEDLDAGLQLFRALPGLGAFDAVLAASAVRAEAVALASADRAFGQVAGLRHLDPGQRDLLD